MSSSAAPKRPADDAIVPLKRQRTDEELPPGSDQQLVRSQGTSLNVGPARPARTSSLDAPIMLLSGHSGAIYTTRFHPSGELLASGSFDKDILVWRLHGPCHNSMLLKGHRNAVLDLHWMNDGSQIISASPDKTLRAWDAETGRQVKKMAEHSEYVNSCCPVKRGPPLVVSGSDDGTVKLWDLRRRGCIQTLPEKFQVTAVGFSEDGDKVFSGGIDNEVKVWELRKNEVVMQLQGHTDTITGLELSPDGFFLLTNAMDSTLKIWDLRPYAPKNRCVKTFLGHVHTVEQNLLKCGWSPDGKRVTAGSGDRMVNVWDVHTTKPLYKLPGHTGSVNQTAFHPHEPIIASCGSDKQIFLGEIDLTPTYL